MRYSKWKATRIKNLGGIRAYNRWIEERSAKGGRVQSPKKGFGSNRKLAITAGRAGGKVSKR